MKIRRETYLYDICIGIFEELYAKAEPKAVFKKLLDSGALEGNGYLNYFMPAEQQREIILKHCKKHKLSKKETDAVAFEVILGC